MLTTLPNPIVFTVNIHEMINIPGSPIAYWLSEKKYKNFGKSISSVFNCKTGLICGNNEKYIRYWYEVNHMDIDFKCSSLKLARYYSWYPYNHGGEKTRWYGSQLEIVYMKNNASSIIAEKNSMLRNSDFYFNEGITWNRVGSGTLFAARKACSGFVFDDVSPTGFCTKENYYYLLGFLNTTVFNDYLRLFCTALKVEIGQIGKVPIIINSTHFSEISDNVTENVQLSKNNWDSVETSWDFKKHPLI